MKIPTPIFSIEYLILNKGKLEKTVKAGGLLVTGFETKIYSELKSSETVINLFDPTFELASDINVHELVNSEKHIVCRYLFGHPDETKFWATPNGVLEGGNTGYLLGSVGFFEPEFTNSGIDITTKIYGSAFEKNLQTVNEVYSLPAKVIDLLTAFETIADKFNIELRFPYGKPNETDFVNGLNELKIPEKPANMTGLDYMAWVFTKYPPTFGKDKEAAFARFNPFSNKGEGSFEIIPMNKRKVRRIYSWNGLDSRIISFKPKLLPFKRDNYKNSPQINYTDSESKENKRNVSNTGSGKELGREYTAETTEEVAKARANVKQAVLFSNIFTAELEIIGDINILPHDLVQIDIYNKLTGKLEMANVYAPYVVNHKIINGQLHTILQLAQSNFKAIEASISKERLTAQAINFGDIEYGNFINSLKDTLASFLPKF